jgi:hypothetical protein
MRPGCDSALAKGGTQKGTPFLLLDFPSNSTAGRETGTFAYEVSVPSIADLPGDIARLTAIAHEHGGVAGLRESASCLEYPDRTGVALGVKR